MFFEQWQEYITEEERVVLQNQLLLIITEMKFPEEYKCDTIFITKFEKNYNGFGTQTH